jgi:Spy/CpxP family protein refolding chaperone
MMRLVPALCVLALACTGVAQDEPGPRPPDVAKGEKVDPAVEAWVKVLAERIADGNRTVRDSAQQALVAVGKPALPHLNGLAKEGDSTVAAEAKKVLERIERMAARGEGAMGLGGPGRRGEGAGARGPGGAQTVENLTRDLNLNPEQEAKVMNALEERSRRMRELFSQVQDGALTREEMMSEMQKMSDQVLKDMKSVLTPEQYSKFEANFRNLRGLGGARRGRGGA